MAGLCVLLAWAALSVQACGTGNAPAAGSGCAASFTGPSVAGQESTIDSGTEIAQSIKFTAASSPGNIQLKLKAIGTPTGNLFVRVEPDQGGAPSGLVTENTTFNAASIPPAPAAEAFYNFVFTPPQSLAAGTYWIILKGNSTFGSTGVSWMGTNAAGAYPSGSATASTNDSVWGIGQVSGKAFLFLMGC